MCIWSRLARVFIFIFTLSQVRFLRYFVHDITDEQFLFFIFFSTHSRNFSDEYRGLHMICKYLYKHESIKATDLTIQYIYIGIGIGISRIPLGKFTLRYEGQIRCLLFYFIYYLSYIFSNLRLLSRLPRGIFVPT